jgi:hypothetical protein
VENERSSSEVPSGKLTYIYIWKITIFNREINYFYGPFSIAKLLNYQRVLLYHVGSISPQEQGANELPLGSFPVRSRKMLLVGR